MAATDLEILALFKNPQSREKAFSLLVEEHRQSVYWLIRRMVSDHHDADDLTQDTFVKVWNNLESFRGDSKLFTWIYRIAANEALAHLRKARLRKRIPFADVEYRMHHDLHDDRYYSGTQIQMKLQQAIDRLPPRQKLIFSMRYYENLSYENISEILGITEGALKASYHHAVKKIENFLKSV